LNTRKHAIENELVVKSSTSNLVLIRDFIKSAAKNVSLNDDTINKIVLAVDEACTNVIKHAYHFSTEGIIYLKIKISDNKFMITIIDEGEHFNPNLVPEPNIKQFHKQKKSGGLGIYLMKKLMDDVSYSSTDNNRNQVVLVKNL